MPVGADPHGGQLTLSEEVAKVLAKLEKHGYFGCRGQRLDHDGHSVGTSVALAEFISKILQAHAL